MSDDVTFANYAELAGRTDGDSLAYVDASLRAAKQMRLVHAALGIASEFFEMEQEALRLALPPHNLADDDFVKELGDCTWFLVLVCKHFDFDVDFYLTAAGNRASELAAITLDAPAECNSGYEVVRVDLGNLNVGFETIVSAVKANLIYNRPYRVDQIQLAVIRSFVAMIRLNDRLTGRPFRDVLQVNIDKLRLRFPTKFTEDAANERADEKFGDLQKGDLV